MRRLISFFCSLLILIILAGRFFYDQHTAQSGVELLLAVSVQESGRDSFSPFIRLRYYNFIPVYRFADEKGTVVVERRDNGRAGFVSELSDQPLRPRELRLKYVIAPPLPFESESQGPNIRFASDFFRYSPLKKFRLSAVRYAVIRVDGAGNALLTGLADSNGVLLVRGLVFAALRTPKNQHGG